MIKMFLRIGHRGAAGYEPENTLRSFKRALELGVDVIELDVHGTKDGKVVVIHDDTVDRTTNGKGRVSDLTLAEIQALDAGQGERIPMLDEVLGMVAGRVPIDIEIKDEGLSREVADILNSRLSGGAKSDDFVISSFSENELAEAGRLMDFKRILLVWGEDSRRSIATALNLRVWGIGARASTVEEKFIKEAHEKGLKLLVWTVDGAAAIARFKSMGVDGIFSNFPDRL